MCDTLHLAICLSGSFMGCVLQECRTWFICNGADVVASILGSCHYPCEKLVSLINNILPSQYILHICQEQTHQQNRTPLPTKTKRGSQHYQVPLVDLLLAAEIYCSLLDKRVVLHKFMCCTL